MMSTLIRVCVAHLFLTSRASLVEPSPSLRGTNGSHYDPVVDIPGLGRVIGNTVGFDSAGKVRQFLKIPFATPPVNESRFCPPQPFPKEQWPSLGLHAKHLGPQCAQWNGTGMNGSEDCLQLNIWAPEVKSSALLPVFVFVYGGGLTGGSAVDPEYTQNTSQLSSKEGLVVVTLNYRVGVLGFFASEDQRQEACTGTTNATGGLNGALDVLLGLRWVKDHISSFGGDPSNITLGGESGGSQIVCYLAHSDLMIPLDVRNYIFESGSCVGPWEPDTMEMSLNYSAKYLSDLVDKHPSLFNNSKIKYANLKHVPIEFLWETDFENAGLSKIAGVDGYVLSDLPRNLKLTVSNTSRALLGTNDLDSTCAPPLDCTNYDKESLIKKVAENGFGEDAKYIVEFYENYSKSGLSVPACASENTYIRGGYDGGCRNETTAKHPHATKWTRIFWQITRDVSVACPIQSLAIKFAKHVGTDRDKVYLYWEDLKSKNFGCSQDYHGGELDILFGNQRRALPEVTAKIQNSWGSFMEDSAPWDAFKVSEDNYLSIQYPANNSNMGTQYVRYFACDFWENYTRSEPENLAKYERFGWYC